MVLAISRQELSGGVLLSQVTSLAFHRSSAVFKKSKFPEGFSSSPCTRLEYTINLLNYQG